MFASEHKGRLKAVEIRGDRSLSFTLSLPMIGKDETSWKLLIQLIAVTGVIRNSATREKAFADADGVVFCAPAIQGRQVENREALREGRQQLEDLFGANVPPMVVQFSRFDDPDAMSIQEIEESWNDINLPVFTAIPKTGQGVRETLGALLRSAYEAAVRNHPSMERNGLYLDGAIQSLVAAMRSGGVS